MSASLVGSEMCIRDRCPHDAPQDALHEGRAGGGSGPGGPRAQAAAQPAPVSYTHLTLPTICSV
eukprot:11706759-Alexandrium_andersonii.AAC.1